MAPNLIVLAGPNGAGKTTAAPKLLASVLHVEEFVNADAIARGISAFRPEEAAFTAGRLMLQRLRELTAQRGDVAFETTLASRSFAFWIGRLINSGYSLRIFFLWLPSPEMAIDRVRDRVLSGGHQVPEEVIRRRYQAGLRNFFQLYRPVAVSWRFLDNSNPGIPRLIARGSFEQTTKIFDVELWDNLFREWR